MPIKCCRGCIPPRRFPGCHAKCKDYIEEKAIYDAKMKKVREKQRLQSSLDGYQCSRRTHKW